MTTWRAALPLALALATAACGGPGRAPTAATTGPVAVQAAGVDPQTIDVPTYERLSAAALAEAIRANDAGTVRRFVAYADGDDPLPTSSQAIARTALAATRAEGAAVTDVRRIAEGGATRRQRAETGITFPRDEADHQTALTEWWYVNGHLASKGVVGPWGKSKYGYEFTLFKVGALLHWAHVAISDRNGKKFRYARQWIPNNQAKASAEKLDVAYGAHVLAATATGYQLKARFGDEQLSLQLSTKKPPLLIGGNGKIDMPEGKDSWYYSQTRMEASGQVVAGGETKAVTGVSWLDHQWGPFFVSGFLDRWDWFSLQFDDGTEYNLFAFRDKDGKAGARHVNRSGADGRGSVGHQFTMDRLAWWKSPVTGMNYTTKWHLELPETAESVELTAALEDQEVARRVDFLHDPLPHYWEGAMLATKRRADGSKVEGLAYCEHFGFKQPVGPR